MQSFFRYPGGKNKIKSIIIDKLNSLYKPGVEYIEPFFGGGSIGLNCAFHKMWINDKDIGIYSLWFSVIHTPNKLNELIWGFRPSVDVFYQYKEDLLSNKQHDILQLAFKKLVVHQLSYSGLGVKSGGPLGGKAQNSKYKIDCRWSPDYICKKIDIIHNNLAKKDVKCTCQDFSTLVDIPNSLLYLDPPYWEKGKDLYQEWFTPKNHGRLCDMLKKTPNKWVLSYDDCSYIRELYNWAKIEEITVNYNIKTSRTRTELLITNA